MTTRKYIAVATLIAGSCFAQNEPAPAAIQAQKFFRLEFTVKELDAAKIVNSRKYVMILAGVFGRSSPSGNIRSGDRVPMHSGTDPVSPLANTQFTYFDLSVNIDCRAATQIDNNLTLNITADINGTGAGPDTTIKAPLTRTTRWGSDVVVPMKKTTLVFSSDDPATNRQMQLELLATPII